MAVNCPVVSGAIDTLDGVISIEVNVAGEEPPPPPQLIIKKRIKTKKKSLFNFINTDSFRYESWHIGASLQISHVTPFLHDNIIRFNPRVSAPRLSLCVTCRLFMFGSVGSQKRCQIRMSQAFPGDTEDNAGRRNIFPDNSPSGLELMNGVF